LVNLAQSADDFSALSHIPDEINEPVTSRPDMWATLPNLRTLGYGLPVVTHDATLSINIAMCNLDRINIDPTK
jgi:hypothetical protein